MEIPRPRIQACFIGGESPNTGTAQGSPPALFLRGSYPLQQRCLLSWCDTRRDEVLWRGACDWLSASIFETAVMCLSSSLVPLAHGEGDGQEYCVCG